MTMPSVPRQAGKSVRCPLCGHMLHEHLAHWARTSNGQGDHPDGWRCPHDPPGYADSGLELAAIREQLEATSLIHERIAARLAELGVQLKEEVRVMEALPQPEPQSGPESEVQQEPERGRTEPCG